MKRTIVITATAVVLALGTWTAGSLYVMRDVEIPEHQILVVADGYEIRRYRPMLVAETTTARSGDDDSRFRALAGFIFGGNDAGANIAMTAPVLMTGGNTVAEPGLVAPPLMQFIMPADFTSDTLPVPIDERIDVRMLPERTVAVRRFGWFATGSARRHHLYALVDALRRDGVQIVGEPVYAGYQPPFSVPFLKRHEMHLEVAVPNDGS